MTTHETMPGTQGPTESVAATDAPALPQVGGNLTTAPPDLVKRFWKYEEALMADDLPTLDALFIDDETTLRADGAGVLLGSDEIRRFRRGRGGAAQRHIASVQAVPVSDTAWLTVGESLTVAGGRGVQTQLWRHDPEQGWRIATAHITGPAVVLDRSIWREAGAPLVAPTSSGPLDGMTVAVKDLFAVAGHRIGAGIPEYLETAAVEPDHATAVAHLLANGASVTGIAQTDQFAYSIAGRNAHYGTPPNPARRGSISGGSSSGPASAVALGQVDIGLASDTGGSIRVPASYQGLWGLRTTHGAVSKNGTLPLAPSFDTIGWITRDASTLRRAAAASLPENGRHTLPETIEFVVDRTLVEQSDPDVVEAFDWYLTGLGRGATEVSLDAGHPSPAQAFPATYYEAFRVVQAAEAWASHGTWITEHPDAVIGDVAERFADAALMSRAQHREAREILDEARARWEHVLEGRVLLLPSVASVAPESDAPDEHIQAVRTATLAMTCVAGILGRPALSVPALETKGGPVGLCLVGPQYADLALVDLGENIANRQMNQEHLAARGFGAREQRTTLTGV
ncbi:AtzH-like domain-containing protein [Citricoccus nitrophenolicus]|uniref:AtzH-like domain-containing protein n=1 Tax=Citricoccus nitrophenolicus TaxID=863575 RepID=A0ABV0IIV9_9MICC